MPWRARYTRIGILLICINVPLRDERYLITACVDFSPLEDWPCHLRGGAFLSSNLRSDGRQYALTANHCSPALWFLIPSLFGVKTADLSGVLRTAAF